MAGRPRRCETPFDCAIVGPQPSGWRDQVTAFIGRREFIMLLGGATVAWPIAARAQQRTNKISRVGFLLNVPSELVDTLFKALRDAGHIEGQNIVFETRFAGNMLERIDQFATELVALHCDLIFAAGPYAIQALTKATSTIPLVAIDLESDPVANRWVASIASPGGNLTGFFLDLPELGGKQIELLKEAVPSLSRVAFLWDSTVGLIQFSATELVARTARVELLSLPIQRREDFKAAFDHAADQQAHAVVVLSSPLIFGQRSLYPRNWFTCRSPPSSPGARRRASLPNRRPARSRLSWSAETQLRSVSCPALPSRARTSLGFPR